MNVEIKVDVGQAERVSAMLSRGFDRYNLTETQQAVEAGAHIIQSTWMTYISGSSVSYSGGEFTVNVVSGDYLRRVQSGFQYPMDGNVLKGGVVVDLDYADTLERGFGPYDIKPGLMASPKVKQKTDSKGIQGPRYIDIPFQHSEKSIPSSIKREAKVDGRSLGVIRLGKGLGKGEFGIRSKTTIFHLRGPEKGAGYTWRTGIFAGLVRNQAGPDNRGQYMTFRRVSENSDPTSWIHPGNDPKPVSKALEENLGPALANMIFAAFEKDVLRISRIMGLGEDEA